MTALGQWPKRTASRSLGHFGVVPWETLLGNARALVERHDAGTWEVTFNARFHTMSDVTNLTDKVSISNRI